MGDHIIPQVLLRGFSYNKHVSKQNQKIKMLTPNKLIRDKISELYQKMGFYSRDTESFLDEFYENPFGKLKVKFENQLISDTNFKFEMSEDDYWFLLRFFVVMWRRNDKQINDAILFAKNFLDDPAYRGMMLDQYKNTSSEELIKLTENKLREELYKEAVYSTTNKDETVLKTYKDYLPSVIINKSTIHFPLHNKYATILNYKNASDSHPDISIEPITNRIWVVLRKNINHRSHMDKVIIPVKYIENDEIIADLIRLYVLDSSSSVVVDDTNFDIVKNRLKDPLNNTLNRNSPRLKEIFQILNT